MVPTHLHIWLIYIWFDHICLPAIFNVTEYSVLLNQIEIRIYLTKINEEEK